MKKLTDEEIVKIEGFLRAGKHLPEDYYAQLFDVKKEYELIYKGKEREEDILADTWAMPFQPVKTFRNGKGDGGWTNKLIFGDNLQALKTLLVMKEKGQLKNADGTPGIRLVYIDPPFATKQEFTGSQDQKAYQDKIAGAKFLEFLRKRLVFLRELLSEDGCIFVHLDWKKGHYVKVLIDEMMGEQNLRNEVIWKRTDSHKGTEKLSTIHDTLFFYAKSDVHHPYPIFTPYSENRLTNAYKFVEQKTGRRYRLDDLMAPGSTSTDYAWKGIKPRPGRHWAYTKDRMHDLEREGKIFYNRAGIPKLIAYLDEASGVPLSTIWLDIPMLKGGLEDTNYPTQKPEALLDRIVNLTTNTGDLVLDCFAGSGTTLAVAEKLGRRWIGVDCGKLAIYTMQKRLLNITESKDLEKPKKKYGKQCKPFTLFNAGLYDYKRIKELPWEEYRDFALRLFQCKDQRHEIAKIELDGYMSSDSVLVFNYQEHPNALMDRGYIDDLHRHLRDKIGRRFFIIAPAASVRFLEDYIEKGGKGKGSRTTKYYILRIPYSIIEEIHNQGFTKIKQPVSEMDVNDTVDAVGFDFIQVPNVECKYSIRGKKGKQELGKGTKECVTKIQRFESKVISRKPLEFKNLETLSMVMLDYDFDGEVFDLDEVYYAEDLKKADYEVHFPENKVKGQMMDIYIDIFGNEKREVKTLKDFRRD